MVPRVRASLKESQESRDPIESDQDKSHRISQGEGDKIDATTLAQLLRGGYIPECYVPPRRVMDLREMVRYRASLIRTRSTIKNKIHAIVLMKGIKINEQYNPFTRPFVEELKRIGDYRIDGYLSVIQSLNERIRDVSKKIKSEASSDEFSKLLMTIPGIGY